MSSGPLRFLMLAVGLWIGARAVILAPDWWPGEAASDTFIVASASAAPSARAARPAIGMAGRAARISSNDMPRLIRHVSYKTETGSASGSRAISSGDTIASSGSAAAGTPFVQLDRSVGASRTPAATLILPHRGPHLSTPRDAWASSPWSISAWLLVRRDQGGTALAQGGTLGGSQAGARIAYRLGGGLSVGARIYAPLRRARGAEIAADLDWRPVASIPVHVRAERRQAVGAEGRSAFALSAHGGISQALPHRLRLDLYGQAGVVGLRSRDLFADGAVRLSAPVGPVELGAGAWGAAQPGAARIDAGPGVSYRLPVRGLNVRVEASWRFRLVGDAAPRSGPALTLGADF